MLKFIYLGILERCNSCFQSEMGLAPISKNKISQGRESPSKKKKKKKKKYIYIYKKKFNIIFIVYLLGYFGEM